MIVLPSDYKDGMQAELPLHLKLKTLIPPRPILPRIVIAKEDKDAS